LRTGHEEGGAGNYIVTSHGGGRESKFFHGAEINVMKGQYILRGTKLGTVGNTGASRGAHLHWEYRQNGKVIPPNLTLGNPIPYR